MLSGSSPLTTLAGHTRVTSREPLAATWRQFQRKGHQTAIRTGARGLGKARPRGDNSFHYITCARGQAKAPEAGILVSRPVRACVSSCDSFIYCASPKGSGCSCSPCHKCQRQRQLRQTLPTLNPEPKHEIAHFQNPVTENPGKMLWYRPQFIYPRNLVLR